MRNDNAWIQTYTGRKFYPLDPDPDEICIEDIAHSLSMQCRYNGHCREFYSVAQHSVLLASDFFCGGHYKLTALLHDASEAYLSDLVRPLKHHDSFVFYREAEGRLQTMIFDKFVFGWRGAVDVVNKFDKEILQYEVESGFIFDELHPDWPEMPHHAASLNFEWWSPARAEREFLNTFENLLQFATPAIQVPEVAI